MIFIFTAIPLHHVFALRRSLNLKDDEVIMDVIILRTRDAPVVSTGTSLVLIQEVKVFGFSGAAFVGSEKRENGGFPAPLHQEVQRDAP